jgi:hypothetical protein
MILNRKNNGNIVETLYDSSNILASSYDKISNDLIITFAKGTQYRYKNISSVDYLRFELAESQGKIFNTHIKQHTTQKLPNIDISVLLTEANDLKNAEKNALVGMKQKELLNTIELVCTPSVLAIDVLLTEVDLDNCVD